MVDVNDGMTWFSLPYITSISGSTFKLLVHSRPAAGPCARRLNTIQWAQRVYKYPSLVSLHAIACDLPSLTSRRLRRGRLSVHPNTVWSQWGFWLWSLVELWARVPDRPYPNYN